MIRDLSTLEKSNQEFIEKFTTNSVQLILTETGFEKSIMDATYPVRFFLSQILYTITKIKKKVRVTRS